MLREIEPVRGAGLAPAPNQPDIIRQENRG